MSISYEIDQASGATYVVWDRMVSAPDFLNHANRLSSDANWPPKKRLHITDMRHAALDDSVDQAALESAAEIYGRQADKLANLRVAVVVGNEFERALAFERIMNGHGGRVVVFNYLHVACAWLGMDPNQVEPKLWQLWAASHGIAG